MCSQSPIPTGWVITSSYSTSNCTGVGVAYNIGNTAGQSYATVCSYSPVPTGWVVSGSFRSTSCVGTTLGYTIRKA
ncbi:hypothetical protein GCM10009787_55270 [Streptomyces bangladeshensis]|uniref:Uncharacterized protein n=1 Tax=Streptomyces bangladeshensis TaxID=295352 RepID=A0ABP5NNR5_9ACTN